MPEHTGEGEILDGQLSFITDNQIAARIKQAENALVDMAFRCSALQRELRELRELVEPRS